MFVENLIVCQLVSVEITISQNPTFDGKSNVTISHHLQNLWNGIYKKEGPTFKLLSKDASDWPKVGIF